MRIGWNGEVLHGLCVRINGKLYETVVDALGTVCWPNKKQDVHKMKIAEMEMLRRIWGYNMISKIRNENHWKQVDMTLILR